MAAKKKIKIQVIDIRQLKKSHTDTGQNNPGSNLQLVLVPLVTKNPNDTDMDLTAYWIVHDLPNSPFLVDAGSILRISHKPEVEVSTPRLAQVYYIYENTLDKWLALPPNEEIELVPSDNIFPLVASSGGYTANGSNLYPSPPATSN